MFRFGSVSGYQGVTLEPNLLFRFFSKRLKQLKVSVPPKIFKEDEDDENKIHRLSFDEFFLVFY